MRQVCTNAGLKNIQSILPGWLGHSLLPSPLFKIKASQGKLCTTLSLQGFSKCYGGKKNQFCDHKWWKTLTKNSILYYGTFPTFSYASVHFNSVKSSIQHFPKVFDHGVLLFKDLFPETVLHVAIQRHFVRAFLAPSYPPAPGCMVLNEGRSKVDIKYRGSYAYRPFPIVHTGHENSEAKNKLLLHFPLFHFARTPTWKISSQHDDTPLHEDR